MGRGDNRRSMKMRARIAQRQKKLRLKRRMEAAKATKRTTKKK